jgi:two-component system sensor histidine kinase KdpD
VVEKQLHNYLSEHGMPQSWGTHETILVCLTPRSNAAEMLAAGRRNADRFHGSLVACYVEQPNLNAADRARLEANLEMARGHGAEIQILTGRDFVDALLGFARERRVTQMFVGHSLAQRRVRLFRSAIERLIDEAEEFDLRLFPHRGTA